MQWFVWDSLNFARSRRVDVEFSPEINIPQFWWLFYNAELRGMFFFEFFLFSYSNVNNNPLICLKTSLTG